MDNTVTQKNAASTKWDVLLDLQGKIADTAGTIGFCEDKLKTKGSFLGDPTAELERAKQKLKELKEMYTAILAAPVEKN